MFQQSFGGVKVWSRAKDFGWLALKKTTVIGCEKIKKFTKMMGIKEKTIHIMFSPLQDFKKLHSLHRSQPRTLHVLHIIPAVLLKISLGRGTKEFTSLNPAHMTEQKGKNVCLDTWKQLNQTKREITGSLYESTGMFTHKGVYISKLLV